MFLDISIVLVTIALVVVCLLMILLVLMQRPKQEGLGAAFGAGVTDQIWGSQTTNVLQKGTTYMGVLLFVLSLSLAMMKSAQNNRNTGLKLTDEQPAAPVAAATTEVPPTPATTTSPAVTIPTPVTPTPVTPLPAEGTTPSTPAETPATPAATPATPAAIPAPSEAPATPAADPAAPTDPK